MVIATTNKDAKAEAEAAFKPQPKAEDTPGRKTHAVINDISDAELERRLIELRNEQLRRTEAKRHELEEGARHTWEKDKEEFQRMCRKIYENGGFRESFIEFASKSNGAFAPNMLLERDLPTAYLPEEIRGDGVTKVKKSPTGRGGAASALKEKAPEKGAGGETPREIVARVVKEGKGKEMSLDDIVLQVSKDEVFGPYLRREPRGFARVVAAAGRLGDIKKVGKNVYTAA